MADNVDLDFVRLSEDVVRPWGTFHNLARKPDKWFVKVIKVKEGHRLSLQKHFKREELWIITEGTALVHKGDDEFEVAAGDRVFIEKEQEHRIKGLTDVEFVEVSFGDFDEGDEIRLEDDYGRVE